jgi:TorA maturation chaperone TorD
VIVTELSRQPPLSEEDEARAHCYALVSRLFYGPPDADFLRGLTAASGDAASSTTETAEADRALNKASSPIGYADAFLALQRAGRFADLESLREEYDDLFIGAGAARVTPYTSGHALPSAPDRHLVALREQLAAWGLARRDSVFEVEDHVSAVCDAMRWLIQAGHLLEEQRIFFDTYVYAGVGAFCEAVAASADTSFYRAAAALTRAFLAIEKESFELHGVE